MPERQKKLTIADRLYSDYTGTATSNLTDSLKHANALIDFNILDFPTGA